MRIAGWDYSRRDLLRRVGNVAQVGGVSLMEYAEGHSRGVRSLDFRTGTGFQFGVLPDRGLDVGRAEYQGISLAWLAPKMFPAPWYYEGGHGDPTRSSGRRSAVSSTPAAWCTSGARRSCPPATTATARG